MIRWILSRDPDLNYKGITTVYALACTAAIVLYVAEKQDIISRIDWMKNLGGVYISLLPFFPCLIWVLSIQLISATPNASSQKKDQ